MTEEGAARTLNVVMATLLGLPVAAFLVWNAATAFTPVSKIYGGLSEHQHAEINRFVSSVAILPILLSWMVGIVWRRFRRA